MNGLGLQSWKSTKKFYLYIIINLKRSLDFISMDISKYMK